MSLLSVLTAFGGGCFAAAIGGMNSFELCGVFAILAAACAMCGASGAATIFADYFAFGPFFGPYVAFVGGVAALAYAKKKGLIDSGTKLGYPLAGLNDPMTIVVGGIFGVIGYLVKNLIYQPLFGGSISPRLVTDTPGITVFTMAIITRLVFGGKLRTGDKFISSGKELGKVIIIGISYGMVIAGIFCAAIEAGIDVDAFAGYYPNLVFGLAAIGLVYSTMGHPFFGCHHIFIMAAEATVQSYATYGNVYLSFFVGTLFGLLAAVIGDISGNIDNKGTDSHIDEPATTIFILTFVVNALFPSL